MVYNPRPVIIRNENVISTSEDGTTESERKTPIETFRIESTGESRRLKELRLDEPGVADALKGWVQQYCARELGDPGCVIEPAMLDAPHHVPVTLMIAKGKRDTAPVVLLSGDAHLVELTGLIVAVVAAYPPPSGGGFKTEVSRALLLHRDPLEGLNPLLSFLARHGILVQALPMRIFRDAQDEMFIVTDAPDTAPHHELEHAIENDLEVFGDPLRAIAFEAKSDSPATEN